MNILTNTLQNNMLDTLSSRAPQQVLQAIKDASARVGVSFTYMVEQASAESSFQANAKAKTSSASGLYQFIESTWMNMIEKYGEKHGLDIVNKSESELLELRNNPQTASLMAAEFAGENKAYLERNWAKGEKKIGSTELYFAHFMGASGAAAFLNARDSNPMQQAAVIFPKAAKANKAVFYDMQTGQARTMDQVYQFFDQKFTNSRSQDQSAPTPLAPVISASSTASDTLSQPISSDLSAIYSDTIRSPEKSTIYKNYATSIPLYNLIANPVELIMMAQMDLDLPFGHEDKHARNRL